MSFDLFQSFVYAPAVGVSAEVPTAFTLYADDRDTPPRTVRLHRGDGDVAARVTYVSVNVPEVLCRGEARDALFSELRELMAPSGSECRGGRPGPGGLVPQ